MKRIIEPDRARKSVTLLDNIPYSIVKDKNGADKELHLSLMMQHGNVESRLANGLKPDGSEGGEKKPVIIWVPGGGYRGSDKNLMVPEMLFLANAGFEVASIYCRGSHEAVFPAQIIDVKTAVRFIRANAKKYNLDAEKIGVMGRSSGGHLAALAGMNCSGYDTAEWGEYYSRVQAVCDWFGPVDVPKLLEAEKIRVATIPDYRWKSVEDTHPGAFIGGDVSTMTERSKEASPPYLINDQVCPMLIMHGDKDRHVPMEVSGEFYEKLVDAGFEHQTDYYVVKNGNHGSDEFFQPVVQDIVTDFFFRYLK